MTPKPKPAFGQVWKWQGEMFMLIAPFPASNGERWGTIELTHDAMREMRDFGPTYYGGPADTDPSAPDWECIDE